MAKKLPEYIKIFQRVISKHKGIHIILIVFLFFASTLVYLFPLIQGLMLLPLDLLVSNYHPWYIPAQILLKNSYMQDSIIQLYPWKHLVFESLKQGVIPFWNPYQHMGMPFMASMKPGVFYPLNVLHILGEVNAWNTLLFLQIFLSMIFTYLLSRDFKLGVLPSILASFAFALNSLMIGVLEFGSEGHVLLWLPLFIFLAKRYLEQQKGAYLFFLGTTVAISIFAGHLQYTAYALILLLAFILFYGKNLKTKTKNYTFLFLSIVLGIGASSIQLLPSLELFSNSYRGAADSYQIFSRGLIFPYQLFRLFSPDFFGNPVTRDLSIGYIETSGYFGIVPLFFCLYAILFSRKNLFVKFFTGVFLISILLSLQGIGQILYILKIPLLTSGEANRIFYLVLFSGSILSGFGFAQFFNEKNHRRNILSLAAFFFTFILIVGSTAIIKSFNGSPNTFIHNIRFSALVLAIFSAGTIFYLLFKRKLLFSGILFLVFVLFLTYFDLFRLGYRFLTFSNEKFLYPDMNVIKYVREASKDSLARNIGLAEPELATYLNVYTIETYNPLYLIKSAQLLQALQKKTNDPLPVNKYFVTNKTEKLKHALDFLGVSLVVIDKNANPSIELFNSSKFQTNFEEIFRDDRYIVYKNLSSYPRFQLYYDFQVAKNDQEALMLLDKEAVDSREKLIVEEDLPINLEHGTGSAKLISSTLNSQVFKAKTDKPAIFYISDTYYPGWTAKVNNKDSKIYKANYNLRAVLIPSGESLIEFSYLPSNFYLALVLTALSFAGLTFILLLHNKV